MAPSELLLHLHAQNLIGPVYRQLKGRRIDGESIVSVHQLCTVRLQTEHSSSKVKLSLDMAEGNYHALEKTLSVCPPSLPVHESSLLSRLSAPRRFYFFCIGAFQDCLLH